MSEPVRSNGWRRIADAFTTPAAGTMFVFGFGSGLPFFLVGTTLAIWLRDSGWSLGPIGLVSSISFLYVFKFLWAPLIDAWRLPLFGRLGRRRGWLLPAQLGVAVGLAAMAVVGPGVSTELFLVLAAFTAFCGATQDVLVDAYRIEIAPLEAQGALAATYTLGYRIGLQLVGAALVLYLAEFASWRVGYFAMAGFALLPALVTLLVAEPAGNGGVERATLAAAYGRPFVEFFRRNGAVLAIALLAFVGLYKLPDQMLSIAGPFYLDSGFTKADIASVSKVYGVVMGLTGAFLGGAAVAALGIRLPLLIAALAVALSNLLFILMSLHPGEIWTFVVAISGDNMSQGFAGTALTAFLASLVNREFTATQYALLSSLANLPGKVVGVGAGYLVEATSYTTFFVFSSISVVPTVVLLWWLWRRVGVPRPA